jgi:hypothetical protein
VQSNGAIEVLLGQRKTLLNRIEEEREQLEQLRTIADDLEGQISFDERLLAEIESGLGNVPQLRLEDSNVRLRGRRLEEIAIQVLAEERGANAEVHYKEWFDLLRARGHRVAGKEPVNTFLAQINRSGAVERIGKRTGRYKIAS